MRGERERSPVQRVQICGQQARVEVEACSGERGVEGLGEPATRRDDLRAKKYARRIGHLEKFISPE